MMVLSIEINYELLLNIIIISWLIEAPFRMLFGMTERIKENTDHYDAGDTFNGLVKIAVIVIVCVF